MLMVSPGLILNSLMQVCNQVHSKVCLICSQASSKLVGYLQEKNSPIFQTCQRVTKIAQGIFFLLN